jgi:magnesium-transporting ATPase (P-type)
MSEDDYQRGLRGGSPNLNERQDKERYKDWYDGNQVYEKKQREHKSWLDQREAERRSDASIDERIKRESWVNAKDKAYRDADKNYYLFFMYLFYAVIFLIAGSIFKWVLEFFKIFIPTFVIWILPIISFVYGIWMAINETNKSLSEAEKTYGKRD